MSLTAAGWTTNATSAQASASRGTTTTVSVTVRSSTTRRGLVDLEVHSSTGKVFQQYWDNQSFTRNVSRTFTATWNVPANEVVGAHSVKVGMFGPGWNPFQHWNDSAGTLTVTPAVTTTTTVPTTTTRPTTTTTTVPPTTTTTMPPTTTTTMPPTTTTTMPPTTTTTTPPTTTTTTPPSGRFVTLPVGAALPSGAQCAARVRPAVEIRPENATANHNRGSRANANNRSDWAAFDRVDGDFAGTTDELIQWAACKWGIDEDIVRAQIIKESYWYQSSVGDNGQSFGVGQVRDTAHQSAFEFSVNARTSTAYNLDYTYGAWRACYEGVLTWLNNTSERNGTYAAGDAWGCIGVWFSGRWYYNNDAYLNQTGDSVHWHYNNKTWLTSSFING